MTIQPARASARRLPLDRIETTILSLAVLSLLTLLSAALAVAAT